MLKHPGCKNIKKCDYDKLLNDELLNATEDFELDINKEECKVCLYLRHLAVLYNRQCIDGAKLEIS